MKITKQSIIESLVVIGIFTGILFPLRYILTTYLSHYWYGGLGVVTIVTLSLYYLSKKQKLGWIGTILVKRIDKRSKRKLGLVFMIFLIVMIYIQSLIVIGILYADNEQTKLLTSALNQQGVHDINSAIKLKSSTPINTITYFKMILILLTPNQISFTVFHVINDLSKNFVLPFFSITLIEDLEVLGIVLFFRYKRSEL